MLLLCPLHGGYAGRRCPKCGTVGVESQYINLSVEVQELLRKLSDEMYCPDDGTDLQELAARAYNLGKED
jgi:hypothetical protein